MSGKKFYTDKMMDLSAYRLERCTDSVRWNKLVEDSPQGTIFSRIEYLDALGMRPALWLCYKNTELRAGIALMETGDGTACILHDLAIYNGVLFTRDHPDQNRAQVLSEQFRCTCYIVAEISAIYSHLEMSLPPQFVDIRPFLWHNYGTAGPKYEAEVRYTSYVCIDGFDESARLEEIPLYTTCNTSRRQEIRYGIQKGVVTEERFDPDLFISFYQATMGRQDIAADELLVQELRAVVCSLHKSGMGRMFIASTADGIPGSIAFFGIDSKRGYYLFGANSPDMRDRHTGTAVLWEGFRMLNASGISEVDLEGVNSPQRGYFKLSFGGSITPYYHLVLGGDTFTGLETTADSQ